MFKSGPSDYTPNDLGAGEVKGRYDPIPMLPPLSWEVRHPHLATLVTGALVAGIMLIAFALFGCQMPLR